MLNHDNKTLVLTDDGQIKELVYIETSDVVIDLISKNDILSASNLVLLTGEGRSHLLKY